MTLIIIFSSLALLLSIGSAVLTVRFILSTSRNMKTVTEAASKAKGLNNRITRVHNAQVKTANQVKALKTQVGKTIGFPKPKMDNSVD